MRDKKRPERLLKRLRLKDKKLLKKPKNKNVHVVKSGETYGLIAQKYGERYKSAGMTANSKSLMSYHKKKTKEDLPEPEKMKPGLKIFIPPEENKK